MEREIQNLNLKIKMSEEFSDNLKSQLQKSEAELQNSRNECSELLQSRDNLKNEYNNLYEELKKVKEEKFSLFELLKQKKFENITLQDTIQTLKSNDNYDFEKSKDSSINEIKLKFLDSRLKDEKNLYDNQISLLNKELENSLNEILNTRKESNQKLLEANMKVQNQCDEVNSLKLEISRLKKSNEAKDIQVDELNNQLLDLQNDYTTLQTTCTRESEAQNNVIELLMKRKKELENDSQNLREKIEELQNLLQKGYVAYNELEMHFDSMKSNYFKDVKELEEENQKLSTELEQSKSTLKALNDNSTEKMFEKHFSFAFETNRKLNNTVNLSDLYTQLIKTKQELTRAVEKNLSLEKTINDLNKKLAEDQPILFKNMQEYEMLKQNLDISNDELYQLLVEKDKYLKEKDIDNQTINNLKRDIKRYEQEVQNLTKQITYLLMPNDIKNEYNSNIQSSSSKNIVVFNNIQELQEKNRELLGLLHEMKEELLNKDSSDDESEQIIKYQQEIESYKSKLEDLEKELDRKNETIESTSQSIDPFKTSANESIEIIVENKELKLQLERGQEELKMNVDNIRRLENEKNNLVEENGRCKNDMFKLSQEIQTQKCQMNEMNLLLEKYQTENESLRERNIKLNNSIENLEKNIILLKDQLEKLNEEFKRKNMDLEFKKEELIMLKSKLDHYLKENERFEMDIKNQNMLIQSMKIMQENCNKIENETINHQLSQIKHLETEVSYYREKIQNQEASWKEESNNLSIRFQNLQDMLNNERLKYIQLQQEYFDYKVNAQTKESNEKQVMDVIPENILSNVTNNNLLSGDSRKNLQMAQDEIKILRGKLANSEEKFQNLQSINVALEENFNKLVKNNNDIKNSVDSQIQLKMLTINNLNQDLTNLREYYDKLVGEKETEIIELKQKSEAYYKELQKIKTDLNEMQEALEKSHQNERKALNELKMFSMIATNEHDDYQNVMELRNKDAQTIFELQIELDNNKKLLFDQTNEMEKLKSELKINKDLLENENNLLKQRCEKLKIRCDQIEQINDNLLNQIEQLNNQLTALQNNSTLFSMDVDQQKVNSNHFLTVVKFLREEKAKFQLKVSKLEDQNMCLKIEIENHNKTIDELKSLLQMEKESSNRVSNIKEFNEILAKAQTVPVLIKNNVELKAQVNQWEKQCNELLEKAKSLEMKEKSLKDLSNKTENEEVKIEFMRKEIENWKNKANALAQQLKNFDAETIKRLMQEKTFLSKQIQSNNAEMNKIKTELDNKMRMIMIAEKELNETKGKLKDISSKNAGFEDEIKNYRTQVNNLQNINNQLKLLARKYKAEMSKVKNSDGKNDIEYCDKETQIDQQLDNISRTDEIQKEIDSKLESFTQQIQQLNAENEALKKYATDKEDVAKKLAQQAKQKLSKLSEEKMNLIKEKESMASSINELRSKILSLENTTEEYVKLKMQYDLEMDRQQQELQTANKQIENLTSQLQQPQTLKQQTSPNSPLINIPTTCCTSKSSTVSTSPVRHSVFPQQQPCTSNVANNSKSTPTVSIKPLTISVQPNLFRPKIHAIEPTVQPQATIQPTQGVSISNASSTSVSSTIPSNFQTNVEVSEASSLSHSNKRALESFDEPSSSNYKKSKNVITINESESENIPTDRKIRISYEVFPIQEIRGVSRESIEESQRKAANQDIEEELSNDVELIFDEEDIDEENDEDENEEENQEENLDGQDDARDSESEDNNSICLDEEDEEEDNDDEEEEEEDEDEEEERENKIEVIEINSDSSEDENDSNLVTETSEVTSTHVSSMATSNQNVNQDPATTTQEDSNEAPQMNSSTIDIVTSQSNRVFDSDAVTSQTSSNPLIVNTSELATSTSQNINPGPRRPLLWTGNPNTVQQTNRDGSRTRGNMRRGLNRNRTLRF